MKQHFFSFLPLLTRSQRKGVLSLMLLVVLLQCCLLLFNQRKSNDVDDPATAMEWNLLQQEIDSLKKVETESRKFVITSFNPNFITDYKGYHLQMSTLEIDRLHAYRKTGKFVNSVQEFQEVTKVSDEWLSEYASYFKFPDWVTAKNTNKNFKGDSQIIAIKDFNSATAEDFKMIKGIGDGYALRIINEREKMGGFVHMDQAAFIWNLPPEVVRSLQKYFIVKKPPVIHKININTASKQEISKIPYINHELSRNILIYRSKKSEPLSIEDLEKINGFPLDKLKIIALYLDF